MHSLYERFTRWTVQHGILLLRLSLGVIFLWFGVLKFIPNLSPAEGLAIRTVEALSFGLIPKDLAGFLIAGMETLIGLGFLTGKALRATLVLLAFHMLGTSMPILLFPREVFKIIPVVPTLEGQYIFKNMILASAGLVLWAKANGARLVREEVDKETRKQVDR